MLLKPLLVSDVRKLLQGKLVNGSEDWYVLEAIYYYRHDLEKERTLMFVSKHDPVNWKEINRKGPSLVITDIDLEELKNASSKTTVIKVESLVQSYWKFIKYYRSLFTIPIVTITGTCGKTTTKDMISHILRKDRNVQASMSSKNEPRRTFPYLMGIDEKTDVAVFEHGLGNSGNIEHQCMMYQPTIGIITTIGVHHLDGCKNLEGYIRAKAEIVGGIKKNGTLIVNADDVNTKKISLKKFKGKVIYFGVTDKSDFKASNIEFGDQGMLFDVHHKNKSYKAFVPGYGEHQVYNALAALAAVSEIGLGMKEAILGLSTYEQMTRHLEFIDGVRGSTIIDDTWTNNPTSIEAALNVLDVIGKDKNIILVLGHINRLGDFEKKYHQEIGSLIAKRTIHTLITIGSKAEEIAEQALREGSTANIHLFKDINGIHEIVKPLLNKDAIMLIKGPMSSKSLIEFAKHFRESN